MLLTLAKSAQYHEGRDNTYHSFIAMLSTCWCEYLYRKIHCLSLIGVAQPRDFLVKSFVGACSWMATVDFAHFGKLTEKR